LRKKLSFVRVEESFELADAGRVTHFPKGFGFDLANTLAGDLELAADFLEGAAVSIDEAKALLEDLAFALGEGFQNIFDLVFESGID
jgi:hypothetical protein